MGKFMYWVFNESGYMTSAIANVVTALIVVIYLVSVITLLVTDTLIGFAVITASVAALIAIAWNIYAKELNAKD